MISLFACYFLYKLHLYSAWNDIIDVVGRTDAEMNDLVTKITTNLGGIEIKTCPSKQCIIVDVNVDVSDDEMFLLIDQFNLVLSEIPPKNKDDMLTFFRNQFNDGIGKRFPALFLM